MTTTRSSHPFYTHDLIVLLGGAALVAIALIAQRTTSAEPAYTSLDRDGLSVPYPQSATWFPPTGDWLPAIISSAQCSLDPKAVCVDRPTARIVVRVYDDVMGIGQAQAGKDHEAEYGNRAKRIIAAEAPRTIEGKTWMCTRFAHVAVGGTSESVAVECSLASNKKLYVVTLTGPEAYVSALEPDIIDKLVVKAGG